MVRMNEKKNVRNIVWKSPDGKRKMGEPRRIWRETVKENLKSRKVKNWRHIYIATGKKRRIA